MEPILVDELRHEITHLRNRVDSIEEAYKSKEIPWYKNVSTLIAAAAFLFSFGTTIVSYKRSSDQDVHSLRAELAGILQRLAALPKENLEAYNKYKDVDPISFANLSGYLNQENLILSKQASDAINRLPKDQVSSTDYQAVALASQNSRNYDAALVNFKNALDAATVLDDEVAALRNLANLQMVTGRTGEARANYQKALDIFAKYTGFDDVTKTLTNVFTELAWAWSEASAQNSDVAAQHLTKAEQILAGLPNGQLKDYLKRQVDETRAKLFATPQIAIGNPPPGPTSSTGTSPLSLPSGNLDLPRPQ
jgi:tetratricopeptide (TPR) repeat protein